MCRHTDWPTSVVMQARTSLMLASIEVRSCHTCQESVVVTWCDPECGGATYSSVPEALEALVEHVKGHLGSAPTQEPDQVEVTSPAR